MANMVVLLDLMLDQLGDATFDAQQLSIYVSLYYMKLGYDAHFHAFVAPMFHCEIKATPQLAASQLEKSQMTASQLTAS